MKREVVQDFLNLPGIAGVALMDGRSRPFFCGLDQTLSFQQREVLAQGIQQVMATTPISFQQFEFQFVRYQVHLHKLESLVLLILASSEFEAATHQHSIEQLKRGLQQDLASAIASFRLLSGTITLSQQNDWPRSSQPLLVPPAIDLQDIVNALNQISQLASRYLGATITCNYWRTTRPEEEWLASIEIDRTAALHTGPSTRISFEQQQQIQAWVAKFVDRCTKIIRDFPVLIAHNLEPHQHRLLFTVL